MFFVFETGADVSRRQIIFEQGSATGGILAYIDAGKLYFSFFENGMASPIYISTSVAVNTIYHATLDFDSVAGLLEGYLYANKLGSVSGAVALGNNSAAGIGGSNGAKVRFHDDQTTTTNTNFEGRVSEIIYYNGTPQVGTIPSVQQYLAGKYASDPIIVDVTATAASITENGGVSSNFVFTKNQPQAFDLTVYYTVSGTATANQDYVALSGSVVIPAYNLSASVSLTPIDDPDLEVSVEDVTVTLAADANYEIGTSPSASTNIVDDESANPSGDYVMWLSAESGVQLAGSNVTGWIDSSAYLQTVSQATAANQPLYDPIGISGKSAIVFDGVDDFLDIASSAELNTVDYTQKSIGLVIETPADVVSRQTIYVQGAKAKGFVIYLDSGNLYFNVWGSDNGNFNISSPVSANSIYRVLISFDGVGGELNMNINGTDLSPVTGVGPLGKHTGSINIGDSTGKVEFHDGSNATGNPFQGKLADIIYYNSVLLPTEKDSLLLYYAVTYP